MEILRTDPLDIALRLVYLSNSRGDEHDKEARRKEKKKLKEEKVRFACPHTAFYALRSDVVFAVALTSAVQLLCQGIASTAGSASNLQDDHTIIFVA